MGQNMKDSPGGMQAGRDININKPGKKKWYYNPWILLIVGALMSSYLIPKYFFKQEGWIMKKNDTPGTLEQTIDDSPQSKQAGRDINSETTIHQTMKNSPGGIQAGGDVVINSDKRLIQSISLHVSIEADTPATQPSEPRVSAGLSSFIALFTRDKTRIRFKTDFTLTEQQVSETRKQVRFIYTPEDPAQILGKEVEFLGQIELLAVNYSEIFKTLGFETTGRNPRLKCIVFINGVQIATFDVGEQPQGTLAAGQANLSVADAFTQMPSSYNNIVSNRMRETKE